MEPKNLSLYFIGIDRNWVVSSISKVLMTLLAFVLGASDHHRVFVSSLSPPSCLSLSSDASSSGLAIRTAEDISSASEVPTSGLPNALLLEVVPATGVPGTLPGSGVLLNRLTRVPEGVLLRLGSALVPRSVASVVVRPRRRPSPTMAVAMVPSGAW